MDQQVTQRSFANRNYGFPLSILLPLGAIAVGFIEQTQTLQHKALG